MLRSGNWVSEGPFWAKGLIHHPDPLLPTCREGRGGCELRWPRLQRGVAGGAGVCHPQQRGPGGPVAEAGRGACHQYCLEFCRLQLRCAARHKGECWILHNTFEMGHVPKVSARNDHAQVVGTTKWAFALADTRGNHAESQTTQVRDMGVA